MYLKGAVHEEILTSGYFQMCFSSTSPLPKGSSLYETHVLCTDTSSNEILLFRMIPCSPLGELEPRRGLKFAQGSVISLLVGLSKVCPVQFRGLMR